MRVIQTLHEINRPSHLPWQLARLGRCVLAVDKSGESPGLTGQDTHRQVANNVSGKSEGKLSQISAAVLLFSFLRNCSHIQDSFSLSYAQSSLFSHLVFCFYSLCLRLCLVSSSSHLLFLMLGDDTLRRPWLIRAHPRGGRMLLLGLYGFSSHCLDFCSTGIALK